MEWSTGRSLPNTLARLGSSKSHLLQLHRTALAATSGVAPGDHPARVQQRCEGPGVWRKLLHTSWCFEGQGWNGQNSELNGVH